MSPLSTFLNASGDQPVNLRLAIRLAATLVILAFTASAQQSPFVSVQVPGSPRGCLYPYQDHRGALWLAGCESGKEGFYLFDGERFYRLLKRDFPVAVVRGMTEDSEGGIWISSTGGTFRFKDGRLEEMVPGSFTSGITRISPDVFITSRVMPHGGSASGRELLRIARTREGWKQDVLVASVPDVQFRLDGSGQVLFGCDGGFCDISAADIISWKPGLNLPIIHHALQIRESYSSDEAIAWRDKEGCLWLRNVDNAAYQCPSDAHIQPLDSSLVSRGFPDLFQLADGSMVIPSFEQMTIGRPGEFRSFTPANGYPGTGVAFGLRDGSIWMSNADGSFVLTTHNALEFWNTRNGLDGDLWAVKRIGERMYAIAGDTIRVLDPNRTQWIPIATVPRADDLMDGPEQTVLVASHSQGVLQLNGDGRILRRSVPQDISRLTRSSSGSLFAAGNGIFQLVIQESSIQLNLVKPKAKGEIGDLAADHHNGLWSCSPEGLFHVSANDGVTLTKQSGLLEPMCLSLAVDPAGNLWDSYQNVMALALLRIEDRNGVSILNFRQEKDIANSLSLFLGFDSRNWLWRGSDDGIYVADAEQAKQAQWVHLGRSDGIPALDANRHAFFSDSDGSIWWGTESSLVHLKASPDLVHPATAPEVFFSAFAWAGKASEIASATIQMPEASGGIAYLGSLQLERKESLRLRYRLLPDHADWQIVDGYQVPIGKLAWGRHTIQVQAQLVGGPWSSPLEELLVVPMPWWISWSALAGYGIAASVITIGTFRFRKKKRTRMRKAFPELAEWRLAALSPELTGLEGSIIDQRFEVGRVIARGGFAVVVEAADLENKRRRCALKIFRQELNDREWLTRRFSHEVAALTAIRHPNVVRIYKSGTLPSGALYLVMEFVEGGTLRNLLEIGALSLDRASRFVSQLGGALDAIHRAGICHRDVKPENLMIRTGANDSEELVLIDFSIAIVKDPDETLHGLSRAAGTIYYMAPEQALGYAEPSTDVYSMAKVILEMLTGKKLSQLLPDAAMDLPVRVKELLQALPVSLSPASIDIIARALEFDPSRRPSAAGEFAETIAADLKAGVSGTLTP